MMTQKGKVVRVTYSEENSQQTDLWMYRMMEKIILEQLNIDATIKADLLRTNQSRIKRLISGGD
ncbi:hypothetical protein E3U55_15835 [Filobacillus milosensis]|uniref:Uncharacterized protein n=1 Tax=Filobacillus milosensis TaxID=94137 RepID=A0A4Y8IEZ0_9BACI|nr:hypothetical protein [Filobacillus milosensis]TFB13589.1 hypothetical protein E3U55_15835 [Filobacillus milosensis]